MHVTHGYSSWHLKQARCHIYLPNPLDDLLGLLRVYTCQAPCLSASLAPAHLQLAYFLQDFKASGGAQEICSGGA